MAATPSRQVNGFRFGIHYAWVIVAIAAFLYMAGGSTQQAFGVLVVPLQESRGWSPIAITLAYALSSISGAMLAPLSGIATDRYGARRVVMVGIVAFIASAIITGAASQVWHIWISYGILLGITQACFGVPIITATSYWFRRRLGVGIGLLQAAQGLGPGVIGIVISILIVSLEWRVAFWALGLVGGAIMIGLMLVFRSRPADLGLRPYGAPQSEPIGLRLDRRIDKERAKAYTSAVQGTVAFWNLVAVHFLGCVGHVIIIIYIIPIAGEAGIKSVTATGILTTLVLVSVVTRFTTPVVAERLGAKRTMAVMYLWQALPVLMLFWAHDLWHFYVFAVVFGIGYGGEGSAFPIINRECFGRGPLGRAYGWQLSGAQIGMALGGWSGGIFFAMFGSYDPAIAMSVAASGFGAAIILSLNSKEGASIPDWEESSTGRRLPVIASGEAEPAGT